MKHVALIALALVVLAGCGEKQFQISPFITAGTAGIAGGVVTEYGTIVRDDTGTTVVIPEQHYFIPVKAKATPAPTPTPAPIVQARQAKQYQVEK